MFGGRLCYPVKRIPKDEDLWKTFTRPEEQDTAIWNVSDFIFLGSAYAGGWSIFSLAALSIPTDSLANAGLRFDPHGTRAEPTIHDNNYRVYGRCTHCKAKCARYIHTYILNIYIAPLQENYSEALPTPARSNKAVLRWEKNAGEVVLLDVASDVD